VSSFLWSLVRLTVLFIAVVLHVWANATRPIATRAPVHRGSLRWWLPWPRRAEFVDDRMWQFARGAQVLLYIWTAVVLVQVTHELADVQLASLIFE